MNPDTWAAIKGKSIVDLVKDDLATLERFDMGQSDKLKLAAWKELLSSTGQVVAVGHVQRRAGRDDRRDQGQRRRGSRAAASTPTS